MPGVEVSGVSRLVATEESARRRPDVLDSSLQELQPEFLQLAISKIIFPVYVRHAACYSAFMVLDWVCTRASACAASSTSKIVDSQKVALVYIAVGVATNVVWVFARA